MNQIPGGVSGNRVYVIAQSGLLGFTHFGDRYSQNPLQSAIENLEGRQMFLDVTKDLDKYHYIFKRQKPVIESLNAKHKVAKV